MNRLSNRMLARLRQTGQGMTEYIIIVALISVAAIAVYQLFGSVIRNQMAAIAEEVAGKDGKASLAKAEADAAKAVTEAAKSKGLNNYTGNNAAAGGDGL